MPNGQKQLLEWEGANICGICKRGLGFCLQSLSSGQSKRDCDCAFSLSPCDSKAVLLLRVVSKHGFLPPPALYEKDRWAGAVRSSSNLHPLPRPGSLKRGLISQCPDDCSNKRSRTSSMSSLNNTYAGGIPSSIRNAIASSYSSSRGLTQVGTLYLGILL